VFFAQQSASWNGGVAFLDWQDRLPDESDDHTWGRMYLITKAVRSSLGQQCAVSTTLIGSFRFK
jgi:hypothetical protein